MDIDVSSFEICEMQYIYKFSSRVQLFYRFFL